MKLWNMTNEYCDESITLDEYIPQKKESDAAFIVLPGGAYRFLAEHEGAGYAEFLNSQGRCAFVLNYRTFPAQFPLSLLDARRAVRLVRKNAEKYGIDKNKIAVVGSSAGGHLAALLSTYFEPIAGETTDETDNEDFIPNAQILAYPVIELLGEGIAHQESSRNFLGDRLEQMGNALSPNNIVSEKTPQAFIWHTISDDAVSVINTLDYSRALHEKNIAAEVHVFPEGGHGLGLAKDNDRVSQHVAQWRELFVRYINYINY
ncbi:MAG: alpha/beta hydrolase [Clostridia bacterium]|nr:alpha/beta hydrolase [Clostridia bacterium]